MGSDIAKIVSAITPWNDESLYRKTRQLGVDELSADILTLGAGKPDAPSTSETPMGPAAPLPTEMDLTASSDALYKKLNRKKRRRRNISGGVFGDDYLGPTLLPL